MFSIKKIWYKLLHTRQRPVKFAHFALDDPVHKNDLPSQKRKETFFFTSSRYNYSIIIYPPLRHCAIILE